MATIKITKKELELSKNLIKEYDKIYGDPNETIWNIDDLEELRNIGEKFINIFRKNLQNNIANKKILWRNH